MRRARLSEPSTRQMLRDQVGWCYLYGEPLDLTKPRTVHVNHDHTCCLGSRSCGACIRPIVCDPLLGLSGAAYQFRHRELQDWLKSGTGDRADN